MALVASRVELVNGSLGDPLLFVDYPGRNDALLFDAGDTGSLTLERLADLQAVFVTHHHMDHFQGLDRIVRANLDRDKVLHVFGPEGTIRRIGDRIRSYEHPCFPFQKLILQVTEIHAGFLRCGRMACAERFVLAGEEERSWTPPRIFETADIKVEAAFVDHTVPCLAFALVEKRGYHPDPERLQTGPLRPGPWIGEVLDRLRREEEETILVDVQGVRMSLGDLRALYFRRTGGARIAYVTDTLWSPAARESLMPLAKRSVRLYCDGFYAAADGKAAQRHRHMTARQAGEFAREAGVRELVLMHFSRRYAGRFGELLEEARAVFPATTACLEPEHGDG